MIYGFSDFLSWRIKFNERSKEAIKNFLKEAHQIAKSKDEDNIDIPEFNFSKWPNHLAFPVSYVRALFEFLLPVVVGIYAILILLF